MFCCGNMSDVAPSSSPSAVQQTFQQQQQAQQLQLAPVAAAKNNENDQPEQPEQQQQQQQQEAEQRKQGSKISAADSHAAGGQAVAWSISFAPSRGAAGKGLRNKKEQAALDANRKVASRKTIGGEGGEAGAGGCSALAEVETESGASNAGSDVDCGISGSGAAAPTAATTTTWSPTAITSSGNSNSNNKQQQQQLLAVVNLADEVEIDEAIAVPRNLTTTRQDMLARNHFDQNRWLCLSRPQYKRSCGVSSLTSVWNALYSRVGYGDQPPISQEEVMTIIGFKPPFEDIRWGPFTGNTSLMRWFHKINKAKGVKLGKAFYFWKPHGSGRTIGLDDAQAEDMTIEALRNPKMALIYHCKNHYFVPIGFRLDPRAPRLAMLPKLEKSETDTRILIGEPSRGGMPSIHERLFSDIAKDLHTEAPFTYNIRHPERGVERREKCKKFGGTLHCLIGFRSDVEGNEDEVASLEGGEEGDEVENNDDDE